MAVLIKKMLYTCVVIVITSTWSFGQSAFCRKEKRITPVNYTFLYKRIHQQIIDELDKGRSIFEVLSPCADTAVCINRELCLYNRFLYTDFLFCFELTGDYAPYSGMEHEQFQLQLLQMRDELFEKWLGSLQYQKLTGLVEWEETDLSGEHFSYFLNRGSEKYGWMEKVIKWIHREPAKNLEARSIVYQMLHARTPFSCITPVEAMSLVQNPVISEAVSCLLASLRQNNCEKNLFELALHCTENDKDAALSILGILSTQRMYFIRDWKGWLEQNLEEEEFNRVFLAIKKSSQLYFQMETYAYHCASANLYPKDISNKDRGPKAYHFWSTALISYKLAELGFDKEIAVKESLRPAKKYKMFIQLPGIAYNLMLSNSIFSGSSGDYSRIIRGQKLGADWGYELFKKQPSGM